MTEKEFNRQVWRPYDSVKLDNGIVARVQNVCFTTKSVRVKLPDGIPEWFKCEMIEEHISHTGEPEDAGIIEDLHNRLMGAEARIDTLTKEKKRLEESLSKNHVGALMKNVNGIIESIREKKKKQDKIESCMAQIYDIVAKMNQGIINEQ